MRLSKFFSALNAVEGGVLSFTLNLAAPDKADGDDVDVELFGIARIEVDREADEIRFYPSSSLEGEAPPEQQFSLLAITLSQLPMDTRDGFDPLLMVELPLVRDEPGDAGTGFSEINAVHIGKQSEEAWLLVRPESEYPRDALPT